MFGNKNNAEVLPVMLLANKIDKEHTMKTVIDAKPKLIVDATKYFRRKRHGIFAQGDM